ncbi:MAG: DUF58 domain-containing protein [Candidatus Limiplasma sp.]|nr:DUF58 domain-containing protein [Candidatus Limiplasma sp.]
MLSDAFLRRLDTLALRMRHPASGGSGGLRRSKALGSSVEFSDFREYALGDDVRRIDWNAYARFERLFLKLFMEEQEQRVHLLLDVSASMGFEKWEAARQLVQMLGYLCLCGGDRVTAYALGRDGAHTRPLQGRQSYSELSDFLEGLTPNGQTRLGDCVGKISLPQGRGVTILVSDLLSEDGYDRALTSLLYRKQEVSVVQLLAQTEWEPRLEDVVELCDSETDEKLILSADYDTLKRYRETARAYVQSAHDFCLSHGVTHVFLIPQTPFEEQMLRELSRSGLIA